MTGTESGAYEAPRVGTTGGPECQPLVIAHDRERTTTATVVLFKPSGKYYTEEAWRVPEGAIGPYDMQRSPDFRRISGGAVLVDTQEPWGYPHLFPGDQA